MQRGMSSDHFVEWRSQMSDEAKDEIPRYRRALLRGDGFFHLVPIAGDHDIDISAISEEGCSSSQTPPPPPQLWLYSRSSSG